jgi:hypothetical protein
MATDGAAHDSKPSDVIDAPLFPIRVDVHEDEPNAGATSFTIVESTGHFPDGSRMACQDLMVVRRDGTVVDKDGKLMSDAEIGAFIRRFGITMGRWPSC